MPAVMTTGSAINDKSPTRSGEPKKAGEQKPAAPPNPKRMASRRKLTYKEQRELTALPAKIEGLEIEQTELHNVRAIANFTASRAKESLRLWSGWNHQTGA